MSSDWQPDPDDFVGYTLVRVAHLLQRRMDETLASVGLNARQFSVLVLLARTPSISAGQLARLVLVTPQSMSELVASLLASGLIARDESAGRGHAMGLMLTPAGSAAMVSAFPLVGQLEHDTTRGLSGDEASRLNAQLHAMLEQLGRRG